MKSTTESSSIEAELVQPSTAPLWIGSLLTFLYIGIMYWLFRERIESLHKMNLNEIGDFLAGAFSPLAFLWLVVSLSLQRGELRQNTAALNLQLKELQQNVTHQSDIAEAAQFELLRELPNITIRNLETTASGADPDTFEYHLHVGLNNLSGPLKETEITLHSCGELIFSEYHGEVSDTLRHGCHRFTSDACPEMLRSSPQTATLSIAGIDVVNREYKKAVEFELDLVTVKSSQEVTKRGHTKYSHFELAWDEVQSLPTAQNK